MGSIYKQYLKTKPIVCGPNFTDSNFSQPSVEGIANTISTTIHGTRYIVGSSPSGNFIDAYPNQIATYYSELGSWVFEDPYIGEEVVNISTNTLYRYNGTEWVSKLAFSPSTFDVPFSVELGGTGATTADEAVDSISACHNKLIFNKDLTLNVNYVIPCFPLVEDTDNVNNFCSGTFIIKKYDNADDMFYKISVTASKKPNVLEPLWGMSTVGNIPSTISACTFTYKSVKWFGIMLNNNRNIFSYGRFIGGGTNISSMELVAYRNSVTGIVYNTEIRDSIDILTDTDSEPIKFYGPLNADNITGATITFTNLVGKLDYSNFPPNGVSNYVLGIVTDTTAVGGFALKWVQVNNGIIVPDTPSDIPTEDIMDGETSSSLLSAMTSGTMTIFDGKTSTDLQTVIESDTYTVLDGMTSADLLAKVNA